MDTGDAPVPRNAARWLAFGPYYGMFPVGFALQVVAEHTQPGDHVLDPFAGRGTSVAAACQRRWKNPHFVGLEFPSFGWCI
jgi:DNA modification methylase